ncbi:MAG: TRASH domain-containing protein [Deltaproteobacteria bacterium]
MRILIATLFTLVFAMSFACKEAAAPTTDSAKKAAQPEKAASQPVPTSFAEKPKAGTQAKCPVSGEVFEVEEDTVVIEHEARHYAFCCAGCDEDFKADPAKFASK